MHVTILSARTGWHTDELLRALSARGHSGSVVPYETLIARVASRGQAVSLESGPDQLLGADAILARIIPNGSLEQILFGPAFTEDGTLNLVGAIRTCMGSVGAQNIRELQQTELIIAPTIKTEGKVFQQAQKLGRPR